MSVQDQASTPFPLYVFQPDLDHFKRLEADRDQSHLLRNIVCRTPGEAWTPMQFKMERSRKRESDFPAPSSDNPVLSLRAWTALEPLIGHCVEPLTVYAGKTEYVMLNVLGFSCPAFDESRSRGLRDDERGLHHVFQFAFHPDVPIETDILRVSPSVNRLFVTARFRQLVEKHGLVGLLWIEQEMVRPSARTKTRKKSTKRPVDPNDALAGDRMRALIEAAFDAEDTAALMELIHPEGRDDATKSHTELTFEAGYRVSSATVRPYVQPKWSIFKHYLLHPPPRWLIDLRLATDSGRESEQSYACGFNEDRSEWCISAYRPKLTKKAKSKPPRRS